VRRRLRRSSPRTPPSSPTAARYPRRWICGEESRRDAEEEGAVDLAGGVDEAAKLKRRRRIYGEGSRRGTEEVGGGRRAEHRHARGKRRERRLPRDGPRECDLAGRSGDEVVEVAAGARGRR